MVIGSHRRSHSLAEDPIVCTNDGMSLVQIKQLIDDGAVHNIVISPGPGSPACDADIGGSRMGCLHTRARGGAFGEALKVPCCPFLPMQASVSTSCEPSLASLSSVSA